MKLFSLVAVAMLLACSHLCAQDTPTTLTREIGVRTNSFNDFGLIYKKQIRENTYRRYRLAFGHVSANFLRNNTIIGFSAGGAMGKEKRRPITDKLQFIYGTELIASVGLSSSSSGSLTVDNGNGGSTTYSGNKLLIVTPTIGIGLVLGAQYNVNQRWYVSAELIPSVSAIGTFAQGSSLFTVQAGFNSASAGITAAYRF